MFLIQISFKRVCLWIRWFTTIDIRCKPWNLYGFLENFRVFYDFEPKLFESFTDLHQLGFVVVLEYEEVSFFDFHLVLFGDLI